MAYGIELLNQFGNRILEFKKTLYADISGQTQSAHQILQTAFDLAVASGQHNPTTEFPTYHGRFSTFASTYILQGRLDSSLNPIDPGSMFVTPSVSWISSEPPFFVVTPRTRKALRELAFYQVGTTGFTANVQGVLKATSFFQTGIVHYGRCENPAGLPYIVAAESPLSDPVGNHGCQIRDEGNEIVFDSRYELFSVFDTIKISKATFDSVILNGQTINIPMPKAVPGVYVACPYYCSFKRYVLAGRTTDRRARIWQSGPQTLTISPIDVDLQPAPQGLVERIYTHDAIIFLARPPA